RLIEDDGLWPGFQQAREQRLLLVTARKRADIDLRAGRTDRQRLHRPYRPLLRPGKVEHAARLRIGGDDADIDVVADRHVEEKAERLAVLRKVGDARRKRVA